MKICLINNLYPPYSRGGAERVVELSAQGFREAGHQIFVISTKPLLKRVKQSERNNIYYISSLYSGLQYIPKVLRLIWHIIGLFDIGGYLRVKTIIKKERPELVITHNLQGFGLLIPLLIKRQNIKHIHVLHDIQLIHPSGALIWGQEHILKAWPPKVYSWFSRLLVGSPDSVIAPSKWLLEMHVKRNFFPESRQQVLLNPIERIIDNPSAQSNNLVKQNFQFIYIGHINEQKGAILLSKAFKHVEKRHSNYQFNLLMAGRIICKNAEQEIAKHRGIKIIKVAHSKLMSLLAGADCLIQPSLIYENSPTVIYEAVSFGIPFIASRIGGTKELGHLFGGILFDPGNSSDLFNKIEYFIYHHEEIKKRAQQYTAKLQACVFDNYSAKLLQQKDR